MSLNLPSLAARRERIRSTHKEQRSRTVFSLLIPKNEPMSLSVPYSKMKRIPMRKSFSLAFCGSLHSGSRETLMSFHINSQVFGMTPHFSLNFAIWRWGKCFSHLSCFAMVSPNARNSCSDAMGANVPSSRVSPTSAGALLESFAHALLTGLPGRERPMGRPGGPTRARDPRDDVIDAQYTVEEPSDRNSPPSQWTKH